MKPPTPPTHHKNNKQLNREKKIQFDNIKPVVLKINTPTPKNKNDKETYDFRQGDGTRCQAARHQVVVVVAQQSCGHLPQQPRWGQAGQNLLQSGDGVNTPACNKHAHPMVECLLLDRMS